MRRSLSTSLLRSGTALGLTLLLSTPGLSRAQEVAPGTSLPADAPVVSVLTGEPAPFPGILVPVERFEAYLRLQAEAEAAAEKLRARDAAVEAAERRAAEAEARADGGWFRRNAFWLGAGTGAVVALTLVLLPKTQN